MIFSKKYTHQKFEKFQREFISKFSWMAFSANNTRLDEFEEYYHFEAHRESNVYQLQLGIKNTEIFIEGWIAGKCLFSSFAEKTQENAEIINKFIHQFLMNWRNLSIELLTSSEGELENQSSADLSLQHRGFEWLKASLRVLEEALKNLKEDRIKGGDLVFQGLLFTGQHPTNQNKIIRLRAFNLDIELLILKTSKLQLTCLNKKMNDHFDTTKPEVSAIISTKRNETLNTILERLEPIGSVILLK